MRWLNAFPDLAGIADPAWRTIAQEAREHVIAPGSVVFKPGDACLGVHFVLDGRVRVSKESACGREVLLYRVTRGEICVLSTASFANAVPIRATVMAETPVRVAVLPAASFHHAFAECPGFREYVSRAYAERFQQIIDLVEGITFGRVDTRLAKWLCLNAQPPAPLRVSQDSLAIEIGTAREVISRHLKQFERQGWVRLGRIRIELLDVDALSQLAQLA
ncbi:MAG: Crp/Fnr family transcriptional regulator [Gammaproteobacteria bacterium]|nr:Crp/Fnr family transcriptional regulator [Gammaproteobacteria bacterium]